MGTAEDPAGQGAADRRTGSRWRAAASATLIVLGLVLGSVSVVTTYARNMLTDTDQFVATFAPLAADPAVQSVLIRATNDVIDEQVDIRGLTSDLFDGLRSLGLPPRASAALGLLEAPAAQGAQNLVRGMVENVITSPTFSDVFRQALAVSHAQAIAALRGDQDSAIVAGPGGALRLQLGPILDVVRTRLLDQGVTFAQAIPTTDRSIVLVQSASIGTAVTAYALLDGVGAWLPWVALALLILGALVARRRRGTTLAAAVSTVVIMGALLAAVGIGRAFGVGALASGGSVITPGAAGVVFDRVTEPLTQRLCAIALLAVIVAVVAWAVGSSRSARAVRGIGSRTLSAVRPGGADAELEPSTLGRVGAAIDRGRTGILAAIALVAAAVVLFAGPLTVPLVLWTLLGAVIAVLAVEVLRRPVRG